MASTTRYPLLSQRECERDGDMHAANRLFPRLYTTLHQASIPFFAYNLLMNYCVDVGGY